MAAVPAASTRQEVRNESRTMKARLAGVSFFMENDTFNTLLTSILVHNMFCYIAETTFGEHSEGLEEILNAVQDNLELKV